MDRDGGNGLSCFERSTGLFREIMRAFFFGNEIRVNEICLKLFREMNKTMVDVCYDCEIGNYIVLYIAMYYSIFTLKNFVGVHTRN